MKKNDIERTIFQTIIISCRINQFEIHHAFLDSKSRFVCSIYTIFCLNKKWALIQYATILFFLGNKSSWNHVQFPRTTFNSWKIIIFLELHHSTYDIHLIVSILRIVLKLLYTRHFTSLPHLEFLFNVPLLSYTM